MSFSNVSYASFPVVEKVSNQTTGSNAPLYLMTTPTLIIWTIVVLTLLVFLEVLLKMKQRTGGRGQMLLTILAWPLSLLFAILLLILGWRGLGCIIGFC